jgi:hypothetical protein
MDAMHVVIIGIDRYDSTELSQLQGSRNDAIAWYRLCVGHLGVPPENIAVLASPRLTTKELGPKAEKSRLRGAARAEVLEEAKRLAEAASQSAGLLTYAGHGVALSSNGQSPTGADLAICPSDVAVDDKKGVVGALRFTELSDIFRSQDSRDNITVFLDTCYSSGPEASSSRAAARGAAGKVDDLDLAKRCVRVEAFTNRLILGARHWTSAYEIQVGGVWRGAASFALQTLMERWALRQEDDILYPNVSHADLLDRMGDMLDVLGVPQMPALWGARRLDEMPFLRPGLNYPPGGTSMEPSATKRKRQVPVNPDKVMLLQFADSGGNPLIRVVVTGDELPAGWTGLTTRTEYWYTNTTAVPTLSTLNMTVQSETDQSRANDFIAGWTLSLSCGQLQGEENWDLWSSGVNNQGTLLQTTDPAGRDTYMGLYVQYSKNGTLQKYAWYRITLLTDGFAYELGSPPGTFTALAHPNPNGMGAGSWKFSTLLPPGT